MSLEQTISQIQENLRKGRLPNEASVSTGVVLPILNALQWPVFDPSVVSPEYTVEGRRVDFALLRPDGRPIVFLEVKRVGLIESEERQLFEYAFHQGVIMAVLTDGQEWNFYLPAEQGDYQQRRVYKLDLLERGIPECSSRLDRYLSHADVISGSAFDRARDDYRNVSRQREIQRILPQPWINLIEEADDSIVESLSEKVEDLCGFKPDSETCVAFLSSIIRPKPPTTTGPLTQPPPQSSSIDQTGFVLHGQQYRHNTVIAIMIDIFEKLAERDPTFPERFAARKHGSRRRYLALDKYELNPNRRDLCEQYSTQLTFGWFVTTNHSKKSAETVIRLACEVAGLDFGKDLVVNLG